MEELISTLSNYSLSDIIIIGSACYAAYYFIKKRVKESKNEKHEELAKYHQETSQKEHHDEDLEKTINQLKTWVTNDKAHIDGLNLHIMELDEKVSKIDASVLDMRIKSMRKTILDAVSVCLNFDKPVSQEFYAEIKQVYADYEALLKENDMENGNCEFSMQLIKDSEMRRAELGAFQEQLYIAPDRRSRQRADEVHNPWWETHNPDNK